RARRVRGIVSRPYSCKAEDRKLRSCLVPRPGEAPETARLQAEAHGIRNECHNLCLDLPLLRSSLFLTVVLPLRTLDLSNPP
nr:hypothetical protein [Tanacetum cinerariifolium]